MSASLQSFLRWSSIDRRVYAFARTKAGRLQALREVRAARRRRREL